MLRSPSISVILAFSFLRLASGTSAAPARTISGRIVYEGLRTGSIVVKLYKLDLPSRAEPPLLQKREIYGSKKPLETVTMEVPGSYHFNELPPGHYSVLGFLDADGNGELGFDPPEPFGWFSSEPAGRSDAVDLTESDFNHADFKLRTPTAFPKEPKRTSHGELRWMKGLPVLQLWGNTEERGFAHGFLVGKQIIDFFEFYVVEDSWRSAKRYQETFVPFLQSHFNYPPEFLEECDAILEGMKASGIDMKVESLGRDFNRADLLAINAYIERRAAFPVQAPSSCSQFAFWADATKGSELEGGLIAARNMDGECDLRKVTVSHFLLFAVDPSEPGHKRWVSTMWPGFVGTLSGINEEGLYSMENAGGTGPGPVVGGIVPCSWVQRHILETQGGDSTPESILQAMEDFRSEGGGITAPGSIILWAVPFRGQPSPAFVWEGDRFGGVMRKPTDVRPLDTTNIMATNHHLVYGYESSHPNRSFGRPISFSSLWRYEAGMNALEAWSRKAKPLGVDEAIELLQIVSHGTTEYSVLFLANERRILVAVDNLQTDMWDAPYMKWAEFSFDELFRR
jgi:uncharacterized protein (DUF2141 family)